VYLSEYSTYRVERVQRHDPIPFCALSSIITKALNESAGKKMLALENLICGVCLARDTTRVGVPRPGERFAGVVFIVDKIGDCY
jgi:hypothetical protein